MLKILSIKELNFYSSWQYGWAKIKILSSFDKYMSIFWLLGPFIYLIERDPADLWLSLIGLTFLIRSFIKKDWAWSKQIWFKFAFLFWVSSIISACLSYDPIFSLSQGVPWIRFPLYAAAAQAWLARDRDIRIIMLIAVIVGLLMMNIILLSEIMIEPKLRLTWPYGDTIPGVYIAKLGLLTLCTLLLINLKNNNILVSFFIGASVIILALTGERTHLLIVICALFTCSFFYKPNIVRYLIFSLILVFLISLISYAKPETFKRIFEDSYHSISNVGTYNKTNEPSYNWTYWGAWRGGIQQGLDLPLFGVGPSGTRNTCELLDETEYKWLPGKNYCGNHPHNFYIQMFAETGIIGLIFGTMMFFSITRFCYKERKKNINCPMASIAFIIPLGLFFPIQQFGSFFGQWGNLFIWFAIGMAISQFQIFKKRREVNYD
mgnify:CR=1 FL=1